MTFPSDGLPSAVPSGWSAAVCLMFLAGLSGCGPAPGRPEPGASRDGSAPATAPASASVSVRIARVETHGHTATEEVVGTVRSRLRATVEAKVAGRIESLDVVPGQSVRQGQRLAVLDARETQARLDSARAVLEQAGRDLDRVARLVKDGAATPSELEAVQSRQRVAAATVAEIETLLGHARVVAPFDGVITRKSADVGDLATPGRPLVEIEDPTRLRFEADVPESLVDEVTAGARMPVRIASRPEPLEGIVAEIAPVSDPLSRTHPIKLDLPPAPGLRAGQFGRVAVPTGQASVPHVPAGAVFRRGQMECAIAVAEGRAHLRLVRTGKPLGADVEIVSGLEPGEQVVVDAPSRLRDGQAVEVVP